MLHIPDRERQRLIIIEAVIKPVWPVCDNTGTHLHSTNTYAQVP